ASPPTYPSSCSGGVSNNYSFSSVGGAVTVNKAALQVTASSPTVPYGEAVPAITPGYSGFVLGQGSSDLTTQPSCTTTYVQGSPASPPTYPSSCSGGVSNNYSFSYVGGAVTVNKAALQVTASSPTVTYGDAVPAITPGYSGFVLGQGSSDLTTQPSCTTTYVQGSPASPPTYPTSCSGGVSNNYSFSYVGGAVTVNKAALQVTASSPTVTYGDAVPAITPGYS